MAGQIAANDVDIDLGRLFSSLARHWLRILSVALLVAALALVFAWLSAPLYKAETRLLIEARESVFTRTEQNLDTNSPVLDEEGVTSQVEVISSSDILKQVADKLNLGRLPEFDDAANMSVFKRLLVMTGLKANPAEVPLEERVLKALRDKLNVYRVERSRVIVIEVSSEDPKLAAAIPNAIADTYLAVQQAAKSQTNADATEWLKPEIADLSQRVKDAEQKVAAFRSHSDLLVGQNNSVLATQQLSELSTELSRVRANRAAAEANAAGVRAALKSGASIDALPEVMSSGLIQRLRETRAQLTAQIADLSTTLLSGHPRIRALNSQLADLDAQIRNEAQKVQKGLETEAKTASLREEQLTADLNQMKAQSARAGEQEVDLRALEREATAQRELLESYLTRYREAASRNERNYSPVDARIFSRAVAPSEPYFPKTVPIAGAAFVGSLLVMAVVTLLQELFSGRAMRAAPSRRAEPIAEVEMRGYDEDEEDRQAVPPAPLRPRRVILPPSIAAPTFEPSPSPERTVAPRRPTAGEVSIETAAERLIAGGSARAIFVSPDGDEAAAAAVMVAREVADAGLRVLLVDLTANGAASWPMLERRTFPGITNLLASEAQFSDVIHADLYSDCHVIPLGTADPDRAMRAADRLPIIMSSLTTAYDLVVVECGPTDAEGIRRLTVDGAEVLVSVLEPSEAVAEITAELAAEGYNKVMLVTPAGYQPPVAPVPDRSAA